MSASWNERVQCWLIEPVPEDVAASIDQLARADDVQAIAVMPDVHLASEVCVGVALATSELIYPAAVGSDIGCGMATVRFEADAKLLEDESNAALVLADLYRRVPGNRHGGAVDVASELLQVPLSDVRLERAKARDGRVQLGTLGRGNHFLEFQADDAGQLWVMVHSGSRGMGQAITTHHLRTAAPEHRLQAWPADSPQGAAYLQDVAWAIRYAHYNRDAMLRAVEGLLHERFGVTADWSSYVNCHHNHVQWEEHDGQRWLVHRKGAQSAMLDEPGLIPGSMGNASFHTAGRGCAEALCSSSHGAGRRLSRTEARHQISPRQLERELRSVWFDHRLVRLLCEEAPSAYKDIHAVMRAQRSLTRIVREMRPVLGYKGR
jgi:tRNA-splicing ligase RtcB